MSTWKTPALKKLCRAILSCKNEQELLNYLRDLCTLEELAELSERWKIVELLADGLTYRAIAGQTGASTTTITRIAHWFNHGEGGYQAVLKKLK